MKALKFYFISLIFVIAFPFSGTSQTKLIISDYGECKVPANWTGTSHYEMRYTLPPDRKVKMTGGFYLVDQYEDLDAAKIGELWMPDGSKCTLEGAKENVEAMLPKSMRKSDPKWTYDKATDTWICECLINSMGVIHGVLHHFDEKRTIYLRYRDGKAYFLNITATAFNKPIEQNQKTYDAIYRSWKPKSNN